MLCYWVVRELGMRQNELSRILRISQPTVSMDHMDFEARVWDCDGGDSEAVRGQHFGNRQGNSKKGEGGLKVLILHYVPQATLKRGLSD